MKTIYGTTNLYIPKRVSQSGKVIDEKNHNHVHKTHGCRYHANYTFVNVRFSPSPAKRTATN